ncbi:MAG: L-threonylcarbamoyladenylate synthase [Planctomycetota bacterium]
MRSEDIDRAAAVIRSGGLVGMPTETVYGLAADALCAEAVVAIFAAKGRPRFDPLIVHVAEPEQAWEVAACDPAAERLAAACWPGPLTLVLPRRPVVPDIVTAGLDTVAVRCPDHPVARALIRAAGRPLAAPSANRFGRISPTCAADVHEQLGDAVALVLDGGPCRVGVESTIVRTGAAPVILRPGGIARERIAAVLGVSVPLADRSGRAAALPPAAPGMLKSHYAPHTPVVVRSGPWPVAGRLAVLSFRGRDLPPDTVASEVLSPGGDPAEAARNLFAALRRLDAAGADLIAVELLSEAGLGAAINDRLRRAAGRG